ncbi:hypothetical protein GJ496_000396 [Pomphorhynchus laevis]|nr:hypothetical protein GJ496_000396 [Pomphorhynchus laevis]
MHKTQSISNNRIHICTFFLKLQICGNCELLLAAREIVIKIEILKSVFSSLFTSTNQSNVTIRAVLDSMTFKFMHITWSCLFQIEGDCEFYYGYSPSDVFSSLEIYCMKRSHFQSVRKLWPLFEKWP